jgi:hypothetical protein
MKRTKRAYDPARPDFKHYENFNSDDDRRVVKSISKFLTRFGYQGARDAKVRVKRFARTTLRLFSCLTQKTKLRSQ